MPLSANRSSNGIITVPSGSTSSEIQQAHDVLFQRFASTSYNNRFGYVELETGGIYTIDEPLLFEARHVGIIGNGALLDASSLADGLTALRFGNLKSANNVGSNTARLEDFILQGPANTDSKKINSNTTGLLVGGTKTVSTTLNGAIDATQTTITLTSGSNLPTQPFSLLIGSEYILVTGGFGTANLTVQRGWLGSTAAAHSNGDAVESEHSASPMVTNVTLTSFTRNFHKTYGSWLGVFTNIRSRFGYYGMYFDTFGGGGAGEENTLIQGGVIDTCFCMLYNSADRLRFVGTSVDYFYNDSLGGSSVSRLIDTVLGGSTELFGCHLEFNYGSNAGETNCPIRIKDSLSSLVINGGAIYFAGTAQNWNNLVQMNGADQRFTMKDTILSSVGKYLPPSGDSHLVGTTDTTRLLQVGPVSIQNCRTQIESVNDVPAGVGLEPYANYFDNGVEYSWGTLSSKTAVTGTAAISNQNAAEGGVTPRSNTTGSKTKITGAGLVVITFPVRNWPCLQAWGFYLNAKNAGGTIKVYEQRLTCDPKWNGSNSLSFVADSRGVQASANYAVPNVGADVWNLISWKNTRTVVREPPKKSWQYFAVVIDTTLMTGDLYLDDLFFGTM